jgi:hypothetical protein
MVLIHTLLSSQDKGLYVSIAEKAGKWCKYGTIEECSSLLVCSKLSFTNGLFLGCCRHASLLSFATVDPVEVSGSHPGQMYNLGK